VKLPISKSANDLPGNILGAMWNSKKLQQESSKSACVRCRLLYVPPATCHPAGRQQKILIEKQKSY